MKLKDIKHTIFPKWANSFNDEKYWQMLNSGVYSTRVFIKTLRTPSNMKTHPGWGGSWSVDFTGEITIELENSYVDACKKSKCVWAIGHTIEHEVTEAKIGIKLARKLYPEQSPYIMANKAPGNLGGDAHVLACKELDNMTELEYDIELSKELKLIKWF